MPCNEFREGEAIHADSPDNSPDRRSETDGPDTGTGHRVRTQRVHTDESRQQSLDSSRGRGRGPENKGIVVEVVSVTAVTTATATVFVVIIVIIIKMTRRPC